MNELRGLWRGKRVDDEYGKWVEGYLIRPEFALDSAYIGYLFSHDDHDIDVAQVDPLTLGECTGLTDKNGKLIFEGDIIRYKKHLFCIEWSADICSFTSRALDGTNFMPCVNVGTMKNCEVISNIHDNSELLPVNGEDGENIDSKKIFAAD